MPQDYDIHLDDKFGHQLLIDLDENTTVRPSAPRS
jgi:hypothetical protein